MADGEKFNLAEECKRLLEDPARFAGVKSEGGKRAKREGAGKLMGRFYHVLRAANLKFGNLQKKSEGFEKGESNGIILHYNFRAMKKLGLGVIAARRVPCACEAWLADKAGNSAPTPPSYCRNSALFDALRDG